MDRTKVGKLPTRYSATIAPDQVRETQLDHFVERVVWGSVVPLVAHLVQGAKLTPGELAELKKLIRSEEKRQKQVNEER
ncbi:MAG: BlaI/MecI/CopY family transcriptional regulator [Planctomycetes bacterium]|nr:BlaI/MecI/CopY family transcriptional regulator [Planctomycetota bacterium]